MRVISEIKGSRLFKTQDGKIVRADLFQVGQNEDEAKLKMAKWSGEYSMMAKIAGSFTAFGLVADGAGIALDSITKRNSLVEGAVLAGVTLGFGGGLTAYFSHRKEVLEKQIKLLQTNEELPTMNISQPEIIPFK